MKAAPLLIFLLSLNSFSQIQNKPELTAPLLHIFTQEAQSRNIDILPRLFELDSLQVFKMEGLAVGEYSWRGNVEAIRLSPELFKDENKAFFVFVHEAGHHFRIPDCYKCKYNISAGNLNARAVYLFKDEILRRWLLNNFFERIKDPNAPHIHF